jgi:hypothetical protein
MLWSLPLRPSPCPRAMIPVRGTPCPPRGMMLAYGGVVVDAAGWVLLREAEGQCAGYVWSFTTRSARDLRVLVAALVAGLMSMSAQKRPRRIP